MFQKNDLKYQRGLGTFGGGVIGMVINGEMYLIVGVLKVATKRRKGFYHKTIFGKRNPAFWVGIVRSWPSIHRVIETLSWQRFLFVDGLCGCVFFIFRRGGDFF